MAARKKVGLPDWGWWTFGFSRGLLSYRILPVVPPPPSPRPTNLYPPKDNTPEELSRYLFLRLLTEEERERHYAAESIKDEPNGYYNNAKFLRLDRRGGITGLTYKVSYWAEHGSHGLDVTLPPPYGHTGMCVYAWDAVSKYDDMPPPFDQMATKLLYILHDEATLLQICPQTARWAHLNLSKYRRA